jgi:hypothetical protein
MKLRTLLVFSLLIVFLAACAPASSPTDPPAATQPPIRPSPTIAAPTPEPETQPPAAVPSEVIEASPLPVATSRGPDLHATDPTTVSLASGQLQFVEFFRFT